MGETMKVICTIALLAVATTAALWVTLGQNHSSHQPFESPLSASSPQQVSVAEITPVLFPEVIVRPGEVVAARRFQIAPRISGRLIRMSVRPGDQITAGHEVAVLAAPEIEQAVQQAQAELRSNRAELADAQADVDRLTTLAKTQAISEDTVRDTRVRRDQAHAAVAAAEAELKSREADLSEMILRAPEDAIVLERLREPGDLVGPLLPVLEAESIQGLRFETWIPLSDTAALLPGMPIEIVVQGRNKPVVGHLKQIVPSADAVTRTCRIEITLPSDSSLIPGEYGDAHIVIGQSPILAVPESALKTQAGVTGAFVVDPGNKARYRSVRTGRQHKSKIEILAGLVSGEQVVVNPLSALADGSPVEIFTTQ